MQNTLVGWWATVQKHTARTDYTQVAQHAHTEHINTIKCIAQQRDKLQVFLGWALLTKHLFRACGQHIHGKKNPQKTHFE